MYHEDRAYPVMPGATRIITRLRPGFEFVNYRLDTLARVLGDFDPFQRPPWEYFWEDARLALMPSAEQYAARKRTNAPTD